ncbi:MAG: DUF192 domain-containing protein [Bacteroidota bacterium]
MQTLKPLLFSSLLFAGACASEPDNKANNTPPATTNAPTSNSTPAKSEPPAEPAFVKEGELIFRSPDGQKNLTRLEIEIADDSYQRQQGLMFRKKMPDSRGMLFTFEAPEEQSFWMHNTYIPLDIVYINDKLEVVSIQKNCATLNDTPLPSGKPAQYVVEINAGLSDKLGIKPGSKVAWVNQVTGEEKGGFGF